MNKLILIFILFSILQVRCKETNVKVDPPIKLSLDQTSIQKLVDSFKTDIKKEKEINTKDSIRINYANKFYDLLSNIYIDSIRVHVDSVLVDSLTITTAFHCNKDIAFRSSLTFQKEMEPKYDTLFRFMKNLKPGTDTIVSFSYMGNHHVRLPSNEEPIIKIFAFPIPIWTKKDP